MQAKWNLHFWFSWPSFASLSNFVDFVRKSNFNVFSFLGKIQYKKQVYFIVFQYMYIQSCKCKSLSVSISRFPSSLVIFFDLLCFGKKEILFQYTKFLFQYISNLGMFLNKLLFEFLLRPKMEYCLVCSILTAKDQSG